jgi:molybdopterin molybdotransferase
MKTIDQIAAELQGYDPQSLSADRVNDFLARLVDPVSECESVSVLHALDRVLAEDVISPISVPPHDNSAMDGFAFDSRQLAPGKDLTLRVVGTAFAGKAWQGTVGPGECLKIMTGAIMPAALDTVVPLEFVQLQGDAITLPANAVQPGDNRRLLGEDLMAGQPALGKGQRLGPAALGLVASLGLPSVKVYRRIRVAYFSTGDEILSLGDEPREGAVFDSNRYTVFGLLTRMGAEVIDMGVIADDPTLLEAAFRDAASRADAIITSGGVSMGEADHTKAMMKKVGDVAFWRIAMRPGRPMAVGRVVGPHAPPLRGSLPPEGADLAWGGPALRSDGPPAPPLRGSLPPEGADLAWGGPALRSDGPHAPPLRGSLPPEGADLAWGGPALRSDGPPAPPLRGSLPPEGAEPALGRPGGSLAEGEKSALLFGLPGNPVAVMVTFLAFVRPALQRLMGCNTVEPVYLKAHSVEPLRKKPGRTEYQRGVVFRTAEGALQVRTTGNQGSGVLSSMVQANGLIVLHHHQGNVAAGDPVDVMMFEGAV